MSTILQFKEKENKNNNKKKPVTVPHSSAGVEESSDCAPFLRRSRGEQLKGLKKWHEGTLKGYC